jgi:hypothetical protein
MITILFITGFLGFAFRAMPLQPPEFATGAALPPPAALRCAARRLAQRHPRGPGPCQPCPLLHALTG